LLELITKHQAIFFASLFVLIILILGLLFIYQKFFYLVVNLKKEINKKQDLDLAQILEENKTLFAEFKKDVNNLQKELNTIKQTQKDIVLQINLTNDSIKQLPKSAEKINKEIIDKSNATFTKIDERIKQFEPRFNHILFSYESSYSKVINEIEQAKNDYFYIKELEKDNIKKQKYINKLKKKLERNNDGT